MVQRSLAKAHAGRVGAALARRSGLDPVAAAVGLHGHAVAPPEDDLTVLYLLAGETAAQSALLDRIQDGVDVLEPGLVEVLGASGIDGMAAALVPSAEGPSPCWRVNFSLRARRDVQAADQLLSGDTPLEVGVCHRGRGSAAESRRLRSEAPRARQTTAAAARPDARGAVAPTLRRD